MTELPWVANPRRCQWRPSRGRAPCHASSVAGWCPCESAVATAHARLPFDASDELPVCGPGQED